jgi:hypothetical protein
MKDFIPTTDLEFYPLYRSELHLYTIALRDYDGKDLDISIDS